MMSTYEILKRDIPRLEETFGSDSWYVQQLKRQLAEIEARRETKENPLETEEYHAMIVPNPKDEAPPPMATTEGDMPKGNLPSRELNNWDSNKMNLPRPSGTSGIGSEEKKGAIVNGDYGETLQRRIVQFAGYLKKMHHRALKEVEGPCFMIFDERSPTDKNGHDQLNEAVTPSIELVLHGFEVAGKDSITMDGFLSSPDLPEEGWREDNSQSRFIQFSFEEKWFCIDMPIQTLFQPEAEQILRSLKGFFYLRDRPEFTLFEEDVEGYDPFRKIYVYGDEQTAAEDMAFIFFQVWKFPVDWRFYVKADAFGDKKTNWEWGTPIE